ncbi:FtsX-like permease family protein [Algoriphagus sp.]|uniref:ABC transporter permease n=1 Tax=Algoriphagus sp. TaxID=1872435 RepID=UPI003284C4ED
MWKNYLEIAWRNLVRQKSFTLINILGLSIGLACCLILLAFVKQERSYDSFHQESNQIYRVVQRVSNSSEWAWTGGAVSAMLRKEFPNELSEVVMLVPASMYLKSPEGISPDDSFKEDHFYYADAGFDALFGFALKEGSWDGVFDNPYQLALTETKAFKYFGDVSAVGKTLVASDGTLFEIKAVLEDLPSNTHMKFDFITGMSSFKSNNNFPLDGEFGSFWWPQGYTYVKRNSNTDVSELSKKIPEVIGNYRNPEEAKNYLQYFQPIEDIHLTAGYEREWTPVMSRQTLFIFGSIGLFVLLLACINFINLATAKAIKRMKEIGIRKVNGALRGQLIRQFLTESFLMNAIALIVGIALIYLILPLSNALLGVQISFSLSADPAIPLFILTIWIVSSLLAGTFPAFYLSGLKPEMILKQAGGAGGKAGLRKSLVVFQFVLSALLVFCGGVAYYQHSFLKNSDMGFDYTQLVAISLNDQAKANLGVLKHELGSLAGVETVNAVSAIPGVEAGWSPSFSYTDMKEGDEQDVYLQYVDASFFDNLSIPLISGRAFSEEFSDQGTKRMMRERFAAMDDLGIVINESAAEWMKKNPDEALGMGVRVFTEENGQLFSDYRGFVVGVVADYHTQNLKDEIVPTIYFPTQTSAFDASNYLLLRVGDKFGFSELETIKSKWKALLPGVPFDYRFVADTIALQYDQEARIGNILGVFALLTLFISCLGLLGLSIFTAEAKRKEIGIRKVLGASVFGIIQKLSLEFLMPVGVGLLISLPIGYYLMDEWLSQFANKVSISPWFFLGTAASSILVAWLTVAMQSWKTAYANPVESIKSE